jgi:hypothetical protein
MNGTPVDPRLLIDGFNTTSFVRLCPVEEGTEAVATDRRAPAQPPSLSEKVSRPLVSGIKALGSGIGTVWRGVKAAGAWVGRESRSLWGYAWRAIKGSPHWIGAAAKSWWSNRYVKAVAAGLAAAAVVIAGIIIVVITLPVSVLCGVIAGIAATIVCLGLAIYYATTHATGFSFTTCFLKSLSGGAVTAATIVSVGSLSAAFSAGWAEMGLLGAGKCALANGIFSTIFEAGTSYLFTGQVSIKKLIIAFAIGAASGPVIKALKDGVVGSRLVQTLLATVSEGRLAISARTAVLFIKETTEVLHVTLTFLKEGATAFGGRLVYLAFSGGFAVSCNIASCLLNNKPITFSGMLASLITGVAMGGIGLAFQGAGLEGLLSKFELLETGLGRVFRHYTVKLITKITHKSLSSGLKSLFKRAFNEREAQLVKED